MVLFVLKSEEMKFNALRIRSRHLSLERVVLNPRSLREDEVDHRESLHLQENEARVDVIRVDLSFLHQYCTR